MQQLVLDASVILKWYLESPNEKNREEALALRNSHVKGIIKLVIPEYATLEIANSLKYNGLKKLLILDAISALYNIKLQKIQSNPKLLQQSIELSDKCNITIYDSYYLALVEKLNCYFVTADEVLVRRTKKILSYVKPLNNFKVEKK